MPEGDTVRRLADSLTARFGDHKVKSSLFRHPRLATVDLSGAALRTADARGKHLLMRFTNGYTIHVHLRMNGGVYERFPRGIAPRRRAFEIEFDNGWATAVDIPILGMLPTSDERQVVGHLGPDICGAYDHSAGVKRLSNAGPIPITQAMLDQRIVAGFGNIYAVELPFIVGISPYTHVHQLDNVVGLLAIGVALIRTNARYGPQNTTGKDLKRTHHWVLSNRTIRCPLCGTRLQRIAQAQSPWQRRHAWCPDCQPSESTHVNLHRASELLSLHPCRQMVNLAEGHLIADVSQPVKTESLTANEGAQKRMK